MVDERRELQDFLLRACHDLRASLRAVRINTELLVRHPEKRTGPEFEQLGDFVTNGARRADVLIDGLASYALALRIQASPSALPAGALLRGALESLRQEIDSSGAQVTSGDLPKITGDPDRLMQLFYNLLRNAISNRGTAAPRVHVSAQKDGDKWVFTVRDNGRGIEASDLDRIFRPFEKLRHDDEHAGLGLSICREIVAGHGGKIWAESTVGSGATFYFTLDDN